MIRLYPKFTLPRLPAEPPPRRMVTSYDVLTAHHKPMHASNIRHTNSKKTMVTPSSTTAAAVFVALAASASAWLALRARKKPLAVRLSLIPGAGQGLFVQREFGKGEVVCRYTGVSRTMREAFRLQDKSYLMRLGHKVEPTTLPIYRC